MNSDPRIDDLYVAISYAPLGVRDAASRGLQSLLGDLLSPALDALDRAQVAHTRASPGILQTAVQAIRNQAELQVFRWIVRRIFTEHKTSARREGLEHCPCFACRQSRPYISELKAHRSDWDGEIRYESAPIQGPNPSAQRQR